MKLTTTPVSGLPVRPQSCQNWPVQGPAGCAAGAQGPILPAAQDGQPKRWPRQAGGSVEVLLRGCRHFFHGLIKIRPPSVSSAFFLATGLLSAATGLQAETSSANLSAVQMGAGQNAPSEINAPATQVNTSPNPQTAAKKPRTAPVSVRSGNNQTPANTPANPPVRPVQLFKPSDEPPPLNAADCSELGDDLAPAMVVLPPGDFMMGSPDSEAGRSTNEDPSHLVTGFEVQRYRNVR